MKQSKYTQIGNTEISLENVVNNCVYSTVEKIIGKDENEEFIYRRKFFFNPITLNPTFWTDILDLSSIKANKLIKATIFREGTNDILYVHYARINNSIFSVWNDRGDTISSVILEYTKTTN